MAELRSIQHFFWGSHPKHKKMMAEWALNSWFSPESYSIDPGLSLPKRRPVGFADLKFEPSLCHVLAGHSVLCFWWSCYCCDMFISFLVTLLLLIQCIPVGLSPVLVAKRDPPLCWASSIFLLLSTSGENKTHFVFWIYHFLLFYHLVIKHGTGISAISDRFLKLCLFFLRCCKFFSQGSVPQEAAAKVAQEINGVAVRCNVMQDAGWLDADGENDSWNHWIWEDDADWFPWFAAKMALKSWCIYRQNKTHTRMSDPMSDIIRYPKPGWKMGHWPWNNGVF